MYFYVSGNRCFVGVDGIPKNTIGHHYFDDDTKIEIYDNRSRKNYFKGLITDLVKENDSAYADKADLEAALPDFFKAPAAGRGYKIYAAVLNQSGTGAPEATVALNELGGAIAWTRAGSGNYIGILNNAFVSGKTICLATNGDDDANLISVSLRFYRFNSDYVILYTQIVAGTFSDSKLNKTSVKIEVYD